MNKNVSSRFQALVAKAKMMNSALEDSALTPQDVLDACFCEAMRLSCEEMDESIRASDLSGTCMASLFCMHIPEEDAVRVFCSTIGDTRLVLFGRTFASVEDAFDVSNHGDPDISSGQVDSYELGITEHDGRAPLPLLAREKANKLTKAYNVGEDHTLQLKRERDRIENEEERLEREKYWYPLPAEVKLEIHHEDPRFNANHIVDLKSPFTFPSIFMTCMPSLERIAAARDLIRDLKEDAALAEAIKVKCTPFRTAASDNTSEQPPAYIIQHQSSFIDRRDPLVDKESLFGRYNLSAMMTRTIGDVYGPRSCFPLPDVAALTIKRSEFARIVLASDGMWDVLTVEEVRKTVMKFRYPEQLAIALAQKARNLRELHKLRKDDITIIVVDIHPDVFEKLFSKLKCTIV